LRTPFNPLDIIARLNAVIIVEDAVFMNGDITVTSIRLRAPIIAARELNGNQMEVLNRDGRVPR